MERPQRVRRVSSAFSQADIQLDFWSPAGLRLIADLICSERHRQLRLNKRQSDSPLDFRSWPISDAFPGFK